MVMGRAQHWRSPAATGEHSQPWPHAPHPVHLTGEVQVLEKKNEEATKEEEEGMSRRRGERSGKTKRRKRKCLGEKQKEQQLGKP